MLKAMKALCSYVAGMIHKLAHARNLVTARGWDERNRTGRMRRRSGDRSRWAYPICAVMVVVATVAAGRVDGAGRTVRVGVYQNKPEIFMDENDHASGFFIDLLKEIAAREGWTLDYVSCEWAECLVALEEGRIDLMPDVAYSPERDQKYDFHRIPVAESWSQVYANPRAQVNGINDLDGRRVAVLKGSIQQTVFEQYMHGFGFKVTIVPTGSLEEAFNLAANGSADAAIANNFFGNFFYQSYGLVKTPIVFNVVTLYYATAQGRNSDLLEAIDRHLGAWIQEPNSIYYTTLSRWMEKSAAYRVPQSVYWGIGITGGLFVVAAGMVLLLRGQVRARTKHLEQANDALRKSEMRYHLISTVASDYMFSTRLDAEGKLVLNWVAGAFETMTGYTFEEYTALGGWRAALHPDDLAVDDRDMEKLRANQPVISEIRTLTQSGKTVWVRVYAHPVLDAERKELVGIYGAVQDITERKRAEIELQSIYAASQRLQRLYAPDELAREMIAVLESIAGFEYGAVLLIDEEQNILMPFAISDQRRGPEFEKMDRAYVALRKIKVGTGITGWVAEKGQSVRLGDVRQDPRYLAMREDIRSELCVPLKLGERTIGVVNMETRRPNAYDDSDQRVLETVSAQMTVAIQNARLLEQVQRHAAELEQRVAERTADLYAALTKTEALYHITRSLITFESLSDMLQAVVDRIAETLPANRVTLITLDQEASRVTQFMKGGPGSSQVVQVSFDELMHGLAGWVLREQQPAISPKGSPDPRESLEVQRRRVETNCGAIVVVPLRYLDQTLGIVTAINTPDEPDFAVRDRELMETMASQAALAIIKARLYANLQDANKALEQRAIELKAAMEQAQEADRLKSAFLATMSHELRTPLNSIIGFTGVLLQKLAGPLNDEQVKQLAMVQVSAHHLLALINDVLDISKIEAGQIEIVKQPFDMRLVIEEALRTTSPQAAKKGLSLVAAIASEVGSMVSDPRRVEQILLNLVNNAIKFTERGEVRVECRIQDGWLETRVRDTGIGIKPEDMDKLFQPFRQIDTGPARRHEGTGLGLSICQKLVLLLGGKIGVESEWGVGSTFTFTLPVSEEAR